MRKEHGHLLGRKFGSSSIRRCFVDQIEVRRKLPPLFPFPLFLSYAQDVLPGVEALDWFGLATPVFDLTVHPVQDPAREFLRGCERDMVQFVPSLV